MKKRFIELPGGKLKKNKGRFGGDHHHSLFEDDFDPNDRRVKVRKTRRQNKIELKRALNEGTVLVD